jgi:hypothetical protein
LIITVRGRGNLNQDTFDNSGAWTASEIDQLVVDLRDVWFVDSYAMVTLLTATWVNWLGGAGVELKLPKSKSPRTYLARMHFFDLLPPDVACADPFPTVEEKASPLLPLSRLDMDAGESAVDDLANFIWPQLPPHVRQGFVDALAEVGINALQHADSSIGFIAAQRFEGDFQGRKAPRLQFVIGDAGIGIRASLAAGRPEAGGMSDRDAILLAMQEGVTGKPGRNSGVGLSTVGDYADAFGGVFRVRSGDGMVVRRLGGEKEIARDVPDLPGTVVAVELASPGRRRR